MLYVLAQEPKLIWAMNNTKKLEFYLNLSKLLEDWHFQNLRQDIFV